MRKFLQSLRQKLSGFRITDGPATPEIYETRDRETHQNTATNRDREEKVAEHCPYCHSKDFVKRGIRKKKFETVQLYLCRNPECGRTFTAQFVKGRHYPLRVIIAGLTHYNLGYGLEETCTWLGQKFGRPSPEVDSWLTANPINPDSSFVPDLRDKGDDVSRSLAQRTGNFGAGTANPGVSTLAEWIKEYATLCRYDRLRPYAVKMCKPQDTIEEFHMAHRQIYCFLYHRPKLRLLLEEHYRHSRFGPLKEYLDAVSAETPHQYFQEGLRISEVRSKFDNAQMIVRGKQNYANELAKFVLSTVRENKLRHETLQRFMVANDSVTIAAEVPVYIRKEDIEHMENVLHFKILDGEGITMKGRPRADVANVDISRRLLLTGHIDLLQVRNGQIHILDYKPNAAKERPIEQLTWYALALSRLTGLRLYEFKCAWFDEEEYFEFYPLHVVKKLAKPKKRVRLKGIAEAVNIPQESQPKATIVSF